MTHSIDAILFDKDGTLYSFDATWGAWCARLIADYAKGDAKTVQALADALVFDLDTQRFHPTSPVIAGTADVSAQLMLPHLPGQNFEALLADINLRAGAVEGAPPVPLRPLLEVWRTRGIKLGVATNDAESAARRQLERSGILDLFDYVVGYDSGFGAKPDAGQLLGFSNALGVPPKKIAMVGDSTHDLIAADRAGMVRIGVLTGPADHAGLQGFADYVVEDISGLNALPLTFPSPG